MEKITSANLLRESILQLEIKQAKEGKLLKEQFKVTYDSLKLVNLLKTQISEIATSTDLKGELLDGIMGVAAGYLTKKVTVGDSHNPLKKLLGTLIQMGVTSLVTKNAGGIKTIISTIINSFLNKKAEGEEEENEEDDTIN